MSLTPSLPLDATLRDARALYFDQMGLAPDGGYSERWVKLELGPIPFAIPNTKTRRDAVRYHDLHHMVTGYRTTWSGEFEISAWEIASGCADKSFAWIINLQGLTAGSVVFPQLCFRAFVRGLRSRNLYRETYDDALLDQSVGQVHARLGLGVDGADATVGEFARYALWVAIAWVTSLGQLALLLAPVVWLIAQV